MKEKFDVNEKKLFESQQLLDDYKVQILHLSNELKSLKAQIKPQVSNTVSDNDVCSQINNDNTTNQKDREIHFNRCQKLLLTNTIEKILTLLKHNENITTQSTELMDIYVHCSPSK
ncbi:unnamed protein product [Trichobilharzia regenti]|nr:unnamed protein product [Trichobilharzia regenti]